MTQESSNLHPPTSNLPPPASHLYLVSNNLKTGEDGKAAAVKYAKNNLLAFIDSDIILLLRNWL